MYFHFVNGFLVLTFLLIGFKKIYSQKIIHSYHKVEVWLRSCQMSLCFFFFSINCIRLVSQKKYRELLRPMFCFNLRGTFTVLYHIICPPFMVKIYIYNILWKQNLIKRILADFASMEQFQIFKIIPRFVPCYTLLTDFFKQLVLFSHLKSRKDVNS